MTPVSGAALPETAISVCICCILLVPFAAAGLSLINTGLGRSRNAGHTMLTSLCVLAVAAGAYFVCGFAWQGLPGGVAHVVNVAEKQWNWIGAQRFLLRDLESAGAHGQLTALLGMLSAGLVAVITLGSGAERWRLGASCAATAVLAGFVYPLFAHWVWGGGWLSQLGSNLALGWGFVDVGGSASIQALGGLAALALAWILGPRYGKYSLDGAPNAVPSHNIVFVLFGCLLTLLGWFGLNIAGVILFTGAGVAGAPLAVINTLLAAGGGLLAAAAITRARFGKPDASLSANGWVGGLAASSASCAFVTPAAAAGIGLLSGALVVLAVPWVELLAVDDPGGAVSVHGLGGLWGVMALGIFGRLPATLRNAAGTLNGGDSGQWLAQLIGVATLLGLVLPLIYLVNWLLDRVYPQRVSVDNERQGMDRSELGADPYPEFVVRREEFIR